MTTPDDVGSEPDQATSPPASRRALRGAAGASSSAPEPPAPPAPAPEAEPTVAELIDTSTIILTRRELRALRAETGSIPVVPDPLRPAEVARPAALPSSTPVTGSAGAPESTGGPASTAAQSVEVEPPAVTDPVPAPVVVGAPSVDVRTETPRPTELTLSTDEPAAPDEAARVVETAVPLDVVVPEPEAVVAGEPASVVAPEQAPVVAPEPAPTTTPRPAAVTAPQPAPVDAAPEAEIVATPELAVVAPSRAGRNLPVAIGVGLGLGAAFLASLYFHKELFGILAVAVMVAAMLELRAALGRSRVSVPLWPLVVGTVGMFVSAYLVGAEALVVALVVTAGAVVIWCVIDTPGVLALRNASAAVFIAAYIPFLASFLGLALAQPDGEWRVVFIVALTVACDTGGYAAGVLFGRRPIAPTVSPKKSWEGLAGSFVLTIAVGVWLVIVLFDAAWWLGVLLGAVAVVAALVGDLAESLIKRDLGIKDMGSVLPGHGGMLDRVDSLLVVAPIVTVLLATLVPA